LLEALLFVILCLNYFKMSTPKLSTLATCIVTHIFYFCYFIYLHIACEHIPL